MMWMVLLVACQHEAEPVAEAVSYHQRVEWTEIHSPARVPITTLAAEVVPAPASELKLAPPISNTVGMMAMVATLFTVEGQPNAPT